MVQSHKSSLVGVPASHLAYRNESNDWHSDRSSLTVRLHILRPGQRIGTATTNVENFTSSLAQPVLIAPTNKDQCKNDDWKNFPQFKNQGQCVSFVERQPKT